MHLFGPRNYNRADYGYNQANKTIYNKWDYRYSYSLIFFPRYSWVHERAPGYFVFVFFYWLRYSVFILFLPCFIFINFSCVVLFFHSLFSSLCFYLVYVLYLFLSLFIHFRLQFKLFNNMCIIYL